MFAPLPRRMLSAATALLFAGWTCGPGVAWAGGVSLAVVGVHGDGQQAPEVLGGIESELVAGFAALGFDVRSGPSLGALLEPERDRILERVYLAPVSRSFDEGRILYEQAQPEPAIVALRRARGELVGAAPFLREGRLQADVPLYLGLCQIALGRDEPAEEAFEDVVRAAPDRVLDSLDYPPNIVAAFERARQRVLSVQGASLAVDVGGAEGARVFVDGRLVGTTPLEVPGLPPGAHSVLVDGGAAGRVFEALELSAGGAARVDRPLDRAGLLGGAGDPLLPARSALIRRLYRALGTTAGVSLVALAGFDEAGDLELTLYSTRSGTFAIPVRASLAGAPGPRAEFVDQLAQRIAAEVDEGGVRPDQVAPGAIPLRLGANPGLTELLLGPAPGSTPAAPAVEPPPVVEAPPRDGPHPAGVVALIVGGLLAGAGAGVAIWAGTRPTPIPVGVLVIQLP